MDHATPPTPSDGFSGPSTPRASGSAATMAAPTATPVGGRAFASPAMIRILLTPATADVTPDEFERMTSAIRQVESIRLANLPPRSSHRNSSGSGPATAQITGPLAKAGEVHITFVTSYDPAHQFLSPFNIHRQVLGVLGLAMCSTANNMERLEQAPAALRQLHPSAVVHRVFGFDVGATRPQTMDLSSMAEASEAVAQLAREAAAASEADESGDMGSGGAARNSQDSTTSSAPSTAHSSSSSGQAGFARGGSTGLVIFPAVRRDLKDVRFYLKTLIPNFIGDVLEGLDTFVKDLHGKPLETPRETLDGAMATTLSNRTVSGAAKTSLLSTNVGAAASSAASRASALFSSFSSTDDSNASASSASASASSPSSVTSPTSAIRKVSSRASKNIQSLSTSGPLGSGRYAKVKADYYLLVGDLWNAARTYDTCMAQLGKERALAGGQDAVWYASALEGWAVARVLTIRMGGLVEELAPSRALPLGGVKEKEKDKTANEFMYAGQAWSDVAEAYSLALTMYSKCLAPASYLLDTMRSVHPDTPRDYTHPLIHATACLAYARLLLAIWASGGWNGETFDQLLLGGVPPALAETTRPTLAVYAQHTTASGIERNEIAAPASQSMTNSSTNALKLLDQIHLYASLAAIYGCLGFARKEAYAIQRLQAIVSVLIAQGIQLQKRMGASSSQALHAGDAAHGTMLTHVASIGGGHGSDSILVLALQVCQTYGINVQLMPLLDMDKSHILVRAAVDAKTGKRLSAPMLNRSRATSLGLGLSASADWHRYAQDEAQARAAAISELLEEAPFGWTEQQVSILKDTIAICEMLQDKEALLFFALILLRDFWPVLGFEEQFQLKDGVSKIMAEVGEKSIDDGEHGVMHQKDHMLQYWGPKDILVAIDLESGGSAGTPSKAFFNDIAVERQQDDGPDWAKQRRRGDRAHASTRTATQETVLVQDEGASFAVTLHNPLLIPLELESVRLHLTTVGNLGATFEAVERKNVILPPSSLHVVRLNGTPRGEGRLCVRGVHVKMPFCAERTFSYEYAGDAASQKTLWKAQSDLDDRCTRTKRIGLDARGSGSTGHGLHALLPKARARLAESLWTVAVIGRVPVLDVRPSAGLRGGGLVLCDGETRCIALTLHNRGQVPVDYVRFTFDDDVQRDIVELLNEGHLEASDVYELEKDLLHRPFLRRDADDAQACIDVGASKTYTFTVVGKLDVRRASIRLHFGEKTKSRELGREHFWVRQTTFAFDVRVLPTVFLDGLQIRAAQPADIAMATGKKRASDLKYGAAIVSVAAHNAHPGDIQVTLKVDGALHNDDGDDTFTRTLPAQASVRMHFVVPRRAPTGMHDALDKPIPKLVERQFIVSSVRRTALEERRMRACFWLRQSLVDRMTLGSVWTDAKSKRSGALGMAGVRVEDASVAMAMYGAPIGLDVRLCSPGLDKSDVGSDGVWRVKANEFVELRCTLTNVTDLPIHARYRLVVGGGADGNAAEKQFSPHVLCISGHMRGPVRRSGLNDDDEDDEKGDTDTDSDTDGKASALLPGTRANVFIGLCFLARGTFPFTLMVTPDDSMVSTLPPLLEVAGSKVIARKGIRVHVQ